MSISRRIQNLLYNNLDRYLSRKTIIIYIQSELFHKLTSYQEILISKTINKLVKDGLIIKKNNLYKLKILKVSNIIPILVEGRFVNSTDIEDNPLKYLKILYKLQSANTRCKLCSCLIHE